MHIVTVRPLHGFVFHAVHEFGVKMVIVGTLLQEKLKDGGVNGCMDVVDA